MHHLSNILQSLYRRIDSCAFCKYDNNPLQHIHGFGAIKPRLLLILVNPTYRNISSAPEYTGPRFPFIGVRQFWKVLAAGGLIDPAIAAALPLRKEWNTTHTEQVQQELLRNKLFLTNIVKCCYNHGDYPHRNVIQEQLTDLAEEIKIVQPKKIIAFGGLVYKTLTGKSVTLSQYWQQEQRGRTSEILSGLNVPTDPCYFPIGRGNPKKAAETLQKIIEQS